MLRVVSESDGKVEAVSSFFFAEIGETAVRRSHLLFLSGRGENVHPIEFFAVKGCIDFIFGQGRLDLKEQFFRGGEDADVFDFFDAQFRKRTRKRLARVDQGFFDQISRNRRIRKIIAVESFDKIDFFS